MRAVAVCTVVMLALLIPRPAHAQASSARAAECSTYARNRSEAENPAGGAMLGGAARGAARGALFGAIIGGGKKAGRGAAVGAAVGGLGSGMRASQNRQYGYQYYYDACMRGQTY